MRMTISTITLAATLALAGCGPKGEKAADETGNSISNVSDVTGNAIVNAATDVKEAVSAVPTSQEFVDKAAKSDAFEIASAKLATDKANSADLKAFAAMMIRDHTGSTAKIKAAASAAMPAIIPDAALTDDQKDKLADLGKLSGKDFDKAYADQQVDAHQAALSLMKLYSDKGDAASLKVAAAEIAPKVQEHLDKIKALRRAQ